MMIKYTLYPESIIDIPAIYKEITGEEFDKEAYKKEQEIFMKEKSFEGDGGNHQPVATSISIDFECSKRSDNLFEIYNALVTVGIEKIASMDLESLINGTKDGIECEVYTKPILHKWAKDDLITTLYVIYMRKLDYDKEETDLSYSEWFKNWLKEQIEIEED